MGPLTPARGGDAEAVEPIGRRYNRSPMFKSLVRTLKGPSRDPRMAAISLPLPRDLHDDHVIAALDLALAADPDPAYLVETLPDALRQVTGKTYEVLDRSTRDVTGAYEKTMVMIREGGVGIWPGHAARAYPLLARDARQEEARATIVATAEGGSAPARKAGWEPPPPPSSRRTSRPVGSPPSDAGRPSSGEG